MFHLGYYYFIFFLFISFFFSSHLIFLNHWITYQELFSFSFSSKRYFQQSLSFVKHTHTHRRNERWQILFRICLSLSAFLFFFYYYFQTNIIFFFFLHFFYIPAWTKTLATWRTSEAIGRGKRRERKWGAEIFFCRWSMSRSSIWDTSLPKSALVFRY